MVVRAQEHWESIYGRKDPAQLSWHQAMPDRSLDMIGRCRAAVDAAIIDVGAGASALSEQLLARGYTNITALDVSSTALTVARNRLGGRASNVAWIAADILTVVLPEHHFDIWHDRAVFHFLTSPADRARYVEQMRTSLKGGANVIIATFGPDGPLKCSGLDVVRYSAETLGKELGPAFSLEESLLDIHPTPFGTQQEFLFCRFTLK